MALVTQAAALCVIAALLGLVLRRSNPEITLLLALAAAAAARFLEMPSAEQREKVKEWLLWAVTEAEKELGSGTGQLKLRQVYDLFLQRFPAIAKRISFATFSYWVDKALIDMREMLNKNKTIYQMVKAGEGAANGSD